MLKQHKNLLFEAISNSDIPLLGRIESGYRDDPFESIGMPKHMNCFVIHILDSPLEYWVWPHPENIGEYHLRYSEFWPNFPLSSWKDQRKTQGTRQKQYIRAIDIDDVVSTLWSWLYDVVDSYLKEEVTEDYWEQLTLYQPFISSSTFRNEDLEPYSSEEKAEIRDSLERFQALIVEHHELTEEQLEYIEQRLDYLSNAVDRLNRFDWKGLAVSTVIGIGINLGVDANTGAALIHMLQQAFHGIRLFLT